MTPTVNHSLVNFRIRACARGKWAEEMRGKSGDSYQVFGTLTEICQSQSDAAFAGLNSLQSIAHSWGHNQ